MTKLIGNRVTGAWSQAKAAQEYRHYCKLFDDMITQTPCLLRRSELKEKKELSCRGCSKDTMMNSLHNRLRALQDQS